MAGGRPSDYSPEIAERLCNEIAGGLSLRKVCLLEWAPDKRTVLRWLDKHEEFRPQYADACEARLDHMADEVLDISDTATGDIVVVDGVERTNNENINRSRLRVDSRKWLLSKMAPKKYGDRVTQELTGPGGGPVQTEDLTNMTPTQRARRIGFALQLGAQAQAKTK